MTTPYTETLKHLAHTADTIPRLPGPHATARAVSRTCGSRITVDLTFTNARLTGYGHLCETCLIGKASAALLAQHIASTPNGITREHLQTGLTALQALLKNNTPLPEPWADLAPLAAITPHRSRHAAAQLPFEAALNGWPLA